MSIVTPNPAPVVPTLSGGATWPTHFRQYTDVTSFTYRTGMTHMALVEGLRHYIQDILTPHINENFAEMEAAWTEQVNTLLAAVDAFIAAESAANAQAIADALNAIAEADIPITDPGMLAVLNTSTTATRHWLDEHYGMAAVVTDARLKAVYEYPGSEFKATLGNDYDPKGAAASVNEALTPSVDLTRTFFAPAPRGENLDDTAVLTALISAAQNVKGTVYLQPGVYRCNITGLLSQYWQANIIGAGRHLTKLQSFNWHNGPVIKFNGGSGSIGGGGLRSLTVDGVSRTDQDHGVELSGCGGVIIEDVEVVNCTTAIVFMNERPGDFTEFCTFEGSVYNCTRMIGYAVLNGVESFHGSGVVGNSVFGFVPGASGPVIETFNNALPYNAPLSLTVFFNGGNQYLFQYGQTTAGRHASYYGHVRMENPAVLGPNAELCKSASANTRVLFNGDVSGLGVGTVVLGTLFLAYKIAYEAGKILAKYKPVSARMKLKSTPTLALAGILDGGEVGLLTVHINGGNYDKAWTYLVYQSPFSPTGTFTQLAQHVNTDNAGIGDPVLTWSDYGLYVSDPQLTESQIAHVQLTPLGGGLSSANLFDQYQAS